MTCTLEAFERRGRGEIDVRYSCGFNATLSNLSPLWTIGRDLPRSCPTHTPAPPLVTRPDWETYFLGIAKAVATRADCRRAQYGAVIVKDCRIVSTGYNGSPSGMESCLDGHCPRGLLTAAELAPLSADYTNCISLHAETNAIAYADRKGTEGASIYISDIHGERGMPCNNCLKLIIAAGIGNIHTPQGSYWGPNLLREHLQA